MHREALFASHLIFFSQNILSLFYFIFCFLLLLKGKKYIISLLFYLFFLHLIKVKVKYIYIYIYFNDIGKNEMKLLWSVFFMEKKKWFCSLRIGKMLEKLL
jgi:hypothetical protein